MHARSLTPAVKTWLANSHHPRILHVFDRACNLINEHKIVCSIVTAQIGNGPFNIVVDDHICFSEHLCLETPISISSTQIRLGGLNIQTAGSKLWNPRPDWGKLHASKNEIGHQLTELSIAGIQLCDGLTIQCLHDTSLNGLLGLFDAFDSRNDRSQFSKPPAYNLSQAIANADISAARTIVSRLSGLGQGLTPAGDDFILGAVYAAWIIHPREVATILARVIADTAAPLTTSLSAAWLRAGAYGETNYIWHQFFNALLIADSSSIQLQVAKLLSIGHTSGLAALVGFISVLVC